MMISNMDMPEPKMLNVNFGFGICEYDFCGEVVLDGGLICVIVWHRL